MARLRVGDVAARREQRAACRRRCGGQARISSSGWRPGRRAGPSRDRGARGTRRSPRCPTQIVGRRTAMPSSASGAKLAGERRLQRRARGTPWAPAPVTATRTPPARLRHHHADQRVLRGAAGELGVAARSGTGKCTAVMISSALERGLEQAGEEVVGRDRRGGRSRSWRPARAAPPGSRPPGRRGRASRRACRGCAPARRRSPPARLASAGMRCRTSGEAATSSWVASAPITSGVAVDADLARARAMPASETRSLGCARSSFSTAGGSARRRGAWPPSLPWSSATASATDWRAMELEAPSWPAPPCAAWIARQTFSGVAGIVDVGDAERRQGVEHGVDHRGRDADRADLAHALDADRVVRARGRRGCRP